MSVSDEAVEAAVEGSLPVVYERLVMPYGASARDYPNHDALRAADVEAEEANKAVLREIMRAALEAAEPLLRGEQPS